MMTRTAIEAALARADRALASGRKAPLILFAAALLLKLIYVVASSDALFVRVPIMDSRYYDQMAQTIAGGQLVQDDAFFMGPLYPYFLGLVYSVFGRDFLLVRVLQVMVGAGTVMLAFLLGRQMFRPVAALAGAVLLTLYGAMTFYESQLLMEWMGAFLNCAALLALLRARDTGSRRTSAVAGALLGLSALARASILVFALAALAWIAWEERVRGRYARSASFAGALLLVLLPAMIHNGVVSRDFLPVTSNAGVNFYIGNGTRANGTFVPIQDVDVIDDVTTRDYVERQTGRAMSPADVSSYWFHRTFEEIDGNWARVLELTVRKTAMFFNGYEVPQIENFGTQRAEFRSLGILFVPLWFVMVFGVLGMLFAVRQVPRSRLLAAFVAIYAASIVVFFVTGRYRAQVAPELCLFAGYALVSLPGRLASLRSAAAVGVAVVALALATSPDLFRIDPDMIRFRELVRNARRLSELKSYAPALREAGKAIAVYPKEPEGYLQRAIVHKESGNDFKAVEDYQRALAIDRAQPSVHYDLAQALRRLNLLEEAVREYRAATEVDPRMAQAFNNMGVTYREMGKYADAVSAFQQAIAVAPRHVRARNNLGACYAEMGREEEAIATFEATAREFPDYANTWRNLAMTYASQRKPRPALDAMRRYAALNPADLSAADAIRKLEIAVLADSTTPEN